ncbi:unnamed protein product [Effrenium voratum]|nr:unnamed protein product [Effrenium voratum]
MKVDSSTGLGGLGFKGHLDNDSTDGSLRQQAAKFAQETVQEQRSSFERYGVWGDFDEPYLTLLPKYEAAQLRIFEEMVRGGHIYRGRKPVYWSPSTRTALAEAELEYPEDHVSPSIYAVFKCTELPADLADFEDLELAVWTTTPWTIPANRAVAVNPELEYCVVKAEWPDAGRARHLVVARGLVEKLQEVLGLPLKVEKEFAGGKLEGVKYEHPISGKETPLVMGGDYITTESGTGLVHTAPGHGADDYMVGQKYGLEVAAAGTLARHFKAIAVQLTGQLKDAGPTTRKQAAEALGHMGAAVMKYSEPALVQSLSDPDSGVRQAAGTALRLIMKESCEDPGELSDKPVFPKPEATNEAVKSVAKRAEGEHKKEQRKVTFAEGTEIAGVRPPTELPRLLGTPKSRREAPSFGMNKDNSGGAGQGIRHVYEV